jgi:general secretion pathway protein K
MNCSGKPAIKGGSSRDGEPGGFILVAVLWILAALATLAMIFSTYLANTAVSLSLNDSDIQTEALVYAALELTAYQVTVPNADGGPGAGPPSSAARLGQPGARNPGAPSPPARGDFSFRLGRANVRASFLPESARIDINAASPDVLEKFFTVFGVQPQQAAELVTRIKGWTSPGVSGNYEEALYRSAGRTYVPRGAPFAHIDELLLVADIPPGIIEMTKPFLTVYSGRAEVSVLDAAPEVVAAIPGMTPNLMQSLAQARQSGADPQSVQRLLGTLPMQNVVTIEGGDTFRVQVRIRYDNGRQAAAEVVIRTGLADKPYGVLWWRTGFDALSNIGPGLAPR